MFTKSGLVFLFLTMIHLNLFSQTEKPTDLAYVVNLNAETKILADYIRQISEQTSYTFSYSDNLINKNIEVELPSPKLPLGILLREIFRKSKLVYIIKKNIIIIKPMKENKFRVSGIIKDMKTGEHLAGASVWFRDLGIAAVSNNYGFYSISADEGTHLISFSYVGYSKREIELSLDENKEIDVELFSVDMYVPEVVVESKRNSNTLSSYTVNNLTAESIKNVTSFVGEADVLKRLAYLPGVQSVVDGSTNISVRGGSFDQNLILLDEAPIYNPSHAMGFFSVFNPDVVQSVDFYKGHIPTKYGSRLSSVIDVRMKEGNSKKIEINGGVGIASTRLSIESPVVNENTSFIISGRYSYIGKVADLSYELVPSAFPGYSPGNIIDFYDFNFKVNTQLSKQTRLFFSYYSGYDKFFFENLSQRNYSEWGNKTWTMRWNYIPSSNLFINSTLLYSRYNYSNLIVKSGQDFNWSAGMNLTAAKIDANYYLNSNLMVNTGASVDFHNINPGSISPVSGSTQNNATQLEKKKAVESAIYVDSEFEPFPNWLLTTGVRFSSFSDIGPTTLYQYTQDYETVTHAVYFGENKLYSTIYEWEPRFSARYAFSESRSLKFSYNRNIQFLHLISNSGIGLPTDIWIPSDENIKPTLDNHFSLGYYHNLYGDKIETSVEAFYRNSDNVIDYKDNADLILNPHIETQMRDGVRKSYGVEFYISKPNGDVTGWVSYTLSRTTQQVSTVNNDLEYFSPFDRTHNFSSELTYSITPNFKVSTDFIYMSGIPITIPKGQFVYETTNYQLYSPKNSYRLPSVHRLDMMLIYNNYNNPDKWFQYEFILGIYNLYNHKNIMSIYASNDTDNKGKLNANYLFGALPYITYNFKF